MRDEAARQDESRSQEAWASNGRRCKARGRSRRNAGSAHRHGAVSGRGQGRAGPRWPNGSPACRRRTPNRSRRCSPPIPNVDTLLQSLAESSPYLWELASGDPARLLRLLTADPDSHLAALLADTGRAVAATDDEAQAMRWLRRMKAEAALLIALADIGGVWPVMRATRALTDLADTAVDAAVRFALAEAARDGRLAPKTKRARRTAAATSCWPWARWAPSSSTTRATSISSCSTTPTRRPCRGRRAGRAVRALTQRLVKLLQERTADGYVFRTDLRLRPDPASTAIAISTAAALLTTRASGRTGSAPR